MNNSARQTKLYNAYKKKAENQARNSLYNCYSNDYATHLLLSPEQSKLFGKFLIQLLGFTKASALEGRSSRAEGRRLSYLLPFKLIGFNAPARIFERRGLRLVVSLNSHAFDPSAFCLRSIKASRIFQSTFLQLLLLKFSQISYTQLPSAVSKILVL